MNNRSQRVVAMLQQERAALIEEIKRIDQALAALGRPPRNGNGSAALGGLSKTIAEFLKERGAMKPRDVSKAVKTDLHATRAAFRQLVRSGIATATGATGSRRWMLVN